MSRLSDLVRQVAKSDAQLAADLADEIKVLERRRSFGLNFERHVPEAVDLPGRPVRKGDKVRFLPERGAVASTVDKGHWQVRSIDRTGANPVASLARLDVVEGVDPETTTRPVEDLVVVAEFRDPIYPGLVPTGRVERGGPEKPFHTVINAENFHALEALLYTHEGKIDAIYIDPPYNTGAKDWKYNNDYVDSDDIYRHSKWLAMMERRLKLAKRLLNPENSVLIVTIDEKEYLRLGLLLQQVFPEGRIQMVSSVINPGGTARTGGFFRTDEYVYVVSLGAAAPASLPLGAEWRVSQVAAAPKLAWENLLRRGTGARRTDRPAMFYPILLTAAGDRIVEVAEPLASTDDRNAWPIPSGRIAVWPLRSDGSEGRWKVGPETLRILLGRGFVRVGRARGTNTSISYLPSGEQKKIEDGVFAVTGRRADGSVEVTGDERAQRFVAGTQWRIPAHNAAAHGTNLNAALLAGRSFPFPKSLYAVEDALRFFVVEKMDAVVLDFFSGSGTTAHAVMRLNKQDGGNRQCISVTNNEVSADEQVGLRKQGLRPGDPEWEKLGICDYITKPRIEAAITGKTPDGEPIKGDYKFTDEFPMSDGFEENAEFFTLTYEAPRSVAHHRSFERIAPLLWLRAGAQGRRIDKASDEFEVADTYGILFDLDAAHEFVRDVVSADGVRMAFIVTDDERGYQDVCAELPGHVEPVRLYSSYLTNFTLGAGID